MSLFLFGNSCYKSKESFKIFSPQIVEVYRILLVKTTLESIIFYYNFSVINTMFVPCTALLYDSTAAIRTLKLFTTLLSISCWICLISFLILEYLRHNFPWDRLISCQTDNPWSTCSQDLNLTISWGGTWKTVSVKTIHRQERASSEKKSDGFHKKCSKELLTILMFELLMCCRTAARCMVRTQY